MARWTKRRRKPSVTWLPNTGAPPTWDTGSLIFPNIIRGFVQASQDPAQADAQDAGFSTVIHRLTADYSAENTGTPIDQTNNSLADYTQAGWRLRRIVGKIFCHKEWSSAAEPICTLVSAGFMVLRTDGNGSPLRIPATHGANNYSPLLWLNERDPWIWQRSWLLGDGRMFFSGNFPTGGSQQSNGWASYPPTNAHYSSASDGPHIDCKTARVIGPEESLFFVLSAFTSPNLGNNPQFTNADGVLRPVPFILQYRLLGSPRRMTNRRNASR